MCAELPPLFGAEDLTLGLMHSKSLSTAKLHLKPLFAKSLLSIYPVFYLFKKNGNLKTPHNINVSSLI